MRDVTAVEFSGSAKAPLPRVRRMSALAGAALLALSLGGCLGSDGVNYRGYVVDAKTMDQVRTGASAEQVLVVLGTPSTTSTIGGDAWYYISQKTERSMAFQQPKVTDQRIFAVYFDKNKKVQRIANYGLEDGRVVDFVTRRTPTAGPESSFLRNMFTGLLRF
jgi:outer membrane protein assembly factor BamE (lipoprotein component of BamABCDE complex)